MLSGILANVTGILDSAFSSWVVTGALDAALIGSFLVYVQNFYQSNSWFNSNKLLTGAFKGTMIGALGGLLAFYSQQFFDEEISRLVGWCISGGAAGYVASLRIPNLKVSISLIAGAIGGGLGLFVMSIGLSYTMGVVVTGAVIGLMVASSEVIFRKTSIDVILKPIETGVSLSKPYSFNLTLGSDPIAVGFASDMDIKLETNVISMQKQVGSVYLEGDKVFYICINDNKKVEITKEKSFNIENTEIILQETI